MSHIVIDPMGKHQSQNGDLMTVRRKQAHSWANHMEEQTKPFLATDKQQAFNAICNVLIKQNKLLIGEHCLSHEDERTVRLQLKQFKSKCRQMMQDGEGVFECAKRYYMLCHAYLTEFTATHGYDDYHSYLEGLWLKNQLMEWENYDGCVRIMHLINHPGKGISPWELFRATETDAQAKVARRSDNSVNIGGTASASTNEAESLAFVELEEWQKELYWQLYSPLDATNMQEDITGNDGINVGNSSLAIPKYDSKYIQDIMKEKVRLLDKKQKGALNEAEAKDLDFIAKVLQDALGGKTKIKNATKLKRERIFKKTEDNKSYACVKMSINRVIAIFPVGSSERELIDTHFRFLNGKFCWESAKQRRKQN